MLVQGQIFSVPLGYPLVLTGLAASMTVNTLVTGLIVFKILKVFLQVEQLKPEATSVERTLSSLSSSASGGTKLRHVLFVIIESGMALFAIQLVRFVLSSLPEAVLVQMGTTRYSIAYNLVVGFHVMFNVIIRSIHHFLLLLFY